jgi:hypothetical protein
MRLLVVGDFRWNSGSSHVIREYVRYAPAAGMEVAVSLEFGSRDEPITRELPYCDDLGWGTHLLVVFEGNPFLSTEDLERIDRVIPRSRRAVVDADGHWAPATPVGDDDNTWPCGSEGWRRQISDVADLVLQPSLTRPSPGAVRFSYFGTPASIAASAPDATPGSKVDVQYIGSNWFRFTALMEVFSAARAALGDCALLRVQGKYWDGSVRPAFEEATRADTAVLARLGIEVCPPVPFGQVVACMGDAIATPVLVRPVLSALGFLTPRMFETAAASTIPVYRQADSYIGELYQDDGELCLGEDPAAKLKEIVGNQKRLRASAAELRRCLYDEYSYLAVLRHLRELLG